MWFHEALQLPTNTWQQRPRAGANCGTGEFHHFLNRTQPLGLIIPLQHFRNIATCLACLKPWPNHQTLRTRPEVNRNKPYFSGDCHVWSHFGTISPTRILTRLLNPKTCVPVISHVRMIYIYIYICIYTI